MSPTRCKARDRFGHRCNRGRHHDPRHTAFGREWRTGEKLRPNASRRTTPGWSRTGMTLTRAGFRAAWTAPAMATKAAA